MKKLYMIFILIIACICTSGCKDNDIFHSQVYGDWVYSTIGWGDDGCAIIDLSEEGKTKEVLVIPNEINGLIVDSIGNQVWYTRSPKIKIENAKKFYIPTSNQIDKSEFSCMNQQINVYISTDKKINSTHVYLTFCDNENCTFYLSKEAYQGFEHWCGIKPNTYIANISYYSDDECYFVDNVLEGCLEVIPPVPLKDGYSFDGWYFNDEKWDFTNNKVEDYFDENNELTLVAKWI